MSPILLTVTTIWTVLVGKFPRDLKFSGSFHHSSCCSCLQKLDISCKTPYPEYIIKTACLKSRKAQKIPVEAAKVNSVETWIKPNNIGENRRLRCFLSSQPGNLLQKPSNQPQKSWKKCWLLDSSFFCRIRIKLYLRLFFLIFLSWFQSFLKLVQLPKSSNSEPSSWVGIPPPHYSVLLLRSNFLGPRMQSLVGK